MNNETQFPTPSEIHAYEMKARQMRAEVTLAGFAAISKFFKSVAHRVSSFLTKPAHA